MGGEPGPVEGIEEVMLAVCLIAVGCGSEPGEPVQGGRTIRYSSSDTLVMSGDSVCPTVTGVALTDDRALVLDGPNSRITAFDEDDDLVSSFGRPGNGPGEMAWPVCIGAVSDSAVLISDYGGLQRFDESGRWRGRILQYAATRCSRSRRWTAAPS